MEAAMGAAAGVLGEGGGDEAGLSGVGRGDRHITFLSGSAEGDEQVL